MSLLINSFTLPDPQHYPGADQGNNPDYGCNLFATSEGLIGMYVKTDAANGGGTGTLSLYNPTLSGVQAPLSQWSTAVSNRLIVGYSYFHNAMVGFNWNNGYGASNFWTLDLRTGAELAVPGASIPNVAGYYNSLNDALECAFDGSFLHILHANGTVYVVNPTAGTVARTYPAPFATNTSSISYDNAGYMYFGSRNNITAHIAKVAVGTGGPLTEGTLVSPYSIPDFNNSASPFYNKETKLAWVGLNLMVYRKGHTEVQRYDLHNDPNLVLISPSPARVPADGTSLSNVLVKVLDTGLAPASGLTVRLKIDNGVTPSAAKPTNNTDLTITAIAADLPTTPVAGAYPLQIAMGTFSVVTKATNTTAATITANTRDGATATVDGTYVLKVEAGTTANTLKYTITDTGGVTQGTPTDNVAPNTNAVNVSGGMAGLLTINVGATPAALPQTDNFSVQRTAKVTYNAGAAVDNVPANSSGFQAHGGIGGTLTLSLGALPATLPQTDTVNVTTTANPVFGQITNSPQQTNLKGEAIFTYKSGTIIGTDELYATVTY